MMSNEFRPAVSQAWAAQMATLLLSAYRVSEGAVICRDRQQLSRVVAPSLARKMGLERARKEEIRAVVDQVVLQLGLSMPVSESARRCGGLNVNVDTVNVVVSGQCFNEGNVNAMQQNNAITIKTVTYVNGVDVKNLNNDQVYGLITSESEKIAKLEALPIKPKSLDKEIAERKAGIEALVAHLDSLEKPAATDAAATATA